MEIIYKKQVVVIPYSHFVWYIKYKRWPTKGLHVHHKDDDPLNNHPDNLEELSAKENHKKRRGKTNGRYGSGKYGYGISIGYGKKTKHYVAKRQLSVEIDGKYSKESNRNIYIGCDKDLIKLKIKIQNYINNYILRDPFEEFS